MIIQVDNLHKVYGNGVVALDGITLRIENGMFGLLGPNGAGKTTFMRILAGLIRPTQGTICADHLDLTRGRDLDTFKATLGYLPQELELYADLSASEFLEYIALLKGLNNGRMRRARITEVLSLVRLTDVARRRLRTFSGGMKRRVGIAQALLVEPQVLIVDEPTAGLDPEERVRFRNLLSELGQDRMVILSTHIVEDVAQTCLELAVLCRGRLLFHGATIEMIESVEGKVWEMAAPPNYKPDSTAVVVASVRQAEMVRYRVLADAAPLPGARSSQPTLEDAYLWMMRGIALD